MSKIIEIEQLSKSYEGRQVVKALSMYVEKGSLFAFLGPNGAGKSTTIAMIAAQLQPDSGSIKVGGHEVGQNDDAIRRLIGIVFQDSLMDPLLTVEENVRIRAMLYGKAREEAERDWKWALQVAGAEDLSKRRYGKLSGGQRRRVDIARALAHRPQIVILDEPTTGLDPQTRRHIWEMIRRLQQEEQLTVFLTTHYMEEAASADYVVVLDHGSIRAQGTPQYLRETYASDVLRLRVHEADELESLLVEGNYAYTVQGGVYVIRLGHTTDALSLLAQCKDNIANLEIVNATLDDVFIELTGSELVN